MKRPSRLHLAHAELAGGVQALDLSADWQGIPSTSKPAMRAMPERPATIEAHIVGVSLPQGLTAPRPVTTTRLTARYSGLGTCAATKSIASCTVRIFLTSVSGMSMENSFSITSTISTRSSESALRSFMNDASGFTSLRATPRLLAMASWTLSATSALSMGSTETRGGRQRRVCAPRS